MSNGKLEVSVHNSIDQIPASDWDSCACPDELDARPLDPFTTHRFLSALESSQSVCDRAGWQPLHLVARLKGDAIAVMPLYAKYNSQGEYVFDYSWAYAFEQAGGQYYPKLQSSVPFTPATGRRFLTKPGYEKKGRHALLSAAISILKQNNLSSLHITFCSNEEATFCEALGLLRRSGEQFHWINKDYRDFGDFMKQLKSRKRRNIRRERNEAILCGGVIETLTGKQIKNHHWDEFWQFYEDTSDRKWGSIYLTRRFFDLIGQSMSNDLLLVMCKRNNRYIAGALNFIGRDTLFGRYWGCIESHSGLHFEMCYYQAIEFAIHNGMSRVEAGAQGPHKLARGYLPVKTHSLHWIANSSFRNAVLKYLEEETNLVHQEIDFLKKSGPYKEYP